MTAERSGGVSLQDEVFFVYCLSLTGKSFHSNFDVYLASRIYYAVNSSSSILRRACKCQRQNWYFLWRTCRYHDLSTRNNSLPNPPANPVPSGANPTPSASSRSTSGCPARSHARGTHHQTPWLPRPIDWPPAALDPCRRRSRCPSSARLVRPRRGTSRRPCPFPTRDGAGRRRRRGGRRASGWRRTRRRSRCLFRGRNSSSWG